MVRVAKSNGFFNDIIGQISLQKILKVGESWWDRSTPCFVMGKKLQLDGATAQTCSHGG